MQTFYGIEVRFTCDIDDSPSCVTLSVLYEEPPDQSEIDQQVSAWRKRMDSLLEQRRTFWTVGRIIKSRVLEYYLQPTPIERYRQELESPVDLCVHHNPLDQPLG